LLFEPAVLLDLFVLTLYDVFLVLVGFEFELERVEFLLLVEFDTWLMFTAVSTAIGKTELIRKLTNDFPNSEFFDFRFLD